jgi:ribosomal protein L11 methyltransferase
MVLFLSECGIPGLQVLEEGENAVLIAYLPDCFRLADLENRVRTYCRALEQIHRCPVDPHWQITYEEGEDWRENWKAYFPPLAVGRRFIVKPSWEDDEGCDKRIVLAIDPGQAFGTGQHASTLMCLEWIEESCGGSDFPPATALDVGTGTGILAIAMAKLGVPKVWAIDTDPLAVQACRENARLNAVDERLTVCQESLESWQGPAVPFAVANLTGPCLMELSDYLARFIEPGGSIVLSGLIAEEKGPVFGRYASRGFAVRGEKQIEEWASLLLAYRA